MIRYATTGVAVMTYVRIGILQLGRESDNSVDLNFLGDFLHIRCPIDAFLLSDQTLWFRTSIVAFAFLRHPTSFPVIFWDPSLRPHTPVLVLPPPCIKSLRSQGSFCHTSLEVLSSDLILYLLYQWFLRIIIYIYIGECMCVCVCILPSVYTSPSVVRSGPNLAHTCKFT